MTARDLFGWWLTQLRDCVPAPLRRPWQRARVPLTLQIGPGRVVFHGPPGAAPVTYDLADAVQGGPSPLLHDVLDRLPGPPQRLRVELDPGQFLLRRLTLPRAARAHLTETVGYQLPRLTPLSAEQMLYACGSEPDDGADDGPLSVWLAAVPRTQIAETLALIGQAPPDNPLRLAGPPAAERPLVFEWPVARPAASPVRRLRLAWVGVLALWIGALVLHVHTRLDVRDRLEQRVDALAAEAGGVVDLRRRLAEAAAQADWLNRRKLDRVTALALLDDLARLLDDQSSLQRLSFNGQELSLMVSSASPSTLIEALEASDSFAGVRFDALTRDRRSDTDRFNINARIEPPARGDG